MKNRDCGFFSHMRWWLDFNLLKMESFITRQIISVALSIAALQVLCSCLLWWDSLWTTRTWLLETSREFSSKMTWGRVLILPFLHELECPRVYFWKRFDVLPSTVQETHPFPLLMEALYIFITVTWSNNVIENELFSVWDPAFLGAGILPEEH